ncbi:LuxR family two component transcriptional regulator [Tepidamorphus gemmatus]|jgi:two-component system response regulator FixJ|uniref:LuxR family two component transcriptional regulator n=1 Tax=Tepidamorphus gemmatus TaxID=747076 RepID=A0A4R3MBM7_9HYPH|nr:response regulator [Tepidamorphus gemmatus]TCT09337.1 LuxR family two component transcriptional regulator [Tepidamorphus gemmatus]
MTPQKTIHIVDDDPAVRDALSVVFTLEGYSVCVFSNAADFLGAVRQSVPDCVLLDVHMPGKSGLDVLRELGASDFRAPIFVISGQGDIPMAVRAIKDGAFDFIEKPFDADTVVQRVAEAIAAEDHRPRTGTQRHSFAGAERLTFREMDVLREITSGATNKEAGRRLGISPRTIEVHRARIMEKLGARNTADLVRIVLSGD